MSKIKLIGRKADNTILDADMKSPGNWNLREDLGIKSNSSPSLAILNNTLYIIYKGETNNNLYYAWKSWNEWHNDNQITIENVAIPRSDQSPNVAIFMDQIYIVYKAHDSSLIYTAKFDGIKWSGNTLVIVNGLAAQSTLTPGICAYNNNLYLIYKGRDSNALHWAKFDGTNWTENRRITVDGVEITSDFNPKPYVFKNKLHIIYKRPQDNILFHTFYDGTTWSGNRIISVSRVNVQSPENPGTCVFRDSLYIVYKGFTNGLLSSRFDGTSWQGNNLIGLSTIENPAIFPVPGYDGDETDWMAEVNGTTLLSAINLPGSHDAAAIRISAIKKSFYACHDHSITEQLGHGIRILDIRIKIKLEGGVFTFVTCHGEFGSSIGLNEYQTLTSVFDECKSFLESHPTEAIVMSLKLEDTTGIGSVEIRTALNSLRILVNNYPIMRSADVPTLDQVRGKIYLINRINRTSSFGTPIDWPDNTDGIEIAAQPNRNFSVFLQDNYKSLVFSPEDEKMRVLLNSFNKPQDDVVITFASGTRFDVMGVYIMDRLLNSLGEKVSTERPKKMGWVMFDYPFNEYYCKQYHNYLNVTTFIINSNFTTKGYYDKFNVNTLKEDLI